MSYSERVRRIERSAKIRKLPGGSWRVEFRELKVYGSTREAALDEAAIRLVHVCCDEARDEEVGQMRNGSLGPA